ncbi:hypothetical protein [Demequina sp. NBRC 110053]|uniref:hypothetical protein n=1 Tax=Demequina sp. NBRC 110053 TaxID=1570342 RepID=UPI0011851A89|nr:hypothetical protein [Demequina sp. NBRC 110053]
MLSDHSIPRTLEIEISNPGEPRVYARVEVSEHGQKLTALHFDTGDDERGVIQQDLRDVSISALLEDFIAGFTFYIDRDAKEVRAPYANTPDFDAALRFASRLRTSPATRNINDALLREVARVYRENIDRHPNKAVEHYFQVRQRTAAEYVSRARKRGYLPPTKRGQKKA